MSIIDIKLEEYATGRQAEFIAAINQHGSARAAAKALGIHHTTVQKSITGLKRRAAQQGYAPEFDLTRPVPDGFILRGASTYYNKEGRPAGQWVKSAIDLNRQLELVREAVEDMCVSVPPLPMVSAPAYADDRLLTVIPLGDPHFGLLTWKDEVGESFDLAIAERLTFAAVDRLSERTPSSKTALLLNLGDYFHADDSTNRTPRSGAKLDVDGRFAKIARIGIRAMERCILRLLEKHERVIVRNNPGNHDPHQAAMLSICLGARFHDNPRVTIDDSPSSFFYHRHGKTLIGSTHGDGAKLADLPLIMAADVPHEWAAAHWRVWHCGHFHHNQTLASKDAVGCTVETHRTLAANDAWHRHAGYRSHRDIKAIVYDIDYGEVMRLRCGVEEVGL